MQRDVVTISRAVSDLLPDRWEYQVTCPHGGVSRLGDLDEEQQVFQEICAFHAALSGCDCARPSLPPVSDRQALDSYPIAPVAWWL